MQLTKAQVGRSAYKGSASPTYETAAPPTYEMCVIRLNAHELDTKWLIDSQ